MPTCRFVALVFFAWTWSAAPFAVAADPNAGRVLFDTYCQQCHGNPLGNFNNVLHGANDPGVIRAQIEKPGSTMGFLQFLLTALDLENLAAYLGSLVGGPMAPPATTLLVEYYHAGFDHYFVTGIGAEIAALDSGTTPGWQRTGLQINAFAAPTSTSTTVCRFFSTAFGPKSSHFYTPFASECTTVKGNRDWTFEGDVFSIDVPDVSGTCAAGETPVYRLYNNGQGEAPNHRYTTDLATRAAMLAKGWIPEGFGDLGIMMCAP